MFDLTVSEEVVEYARGVLAKHNFGRRGVGDGSGEEQLTGLVGQSVIQDLFGYPRTDGSSGPDGGVDLVFHGLSIDVKTMGRGHRPRPEWANNFSSLQEHFPTDLLLFCSYNRKMQILTVCGWTCKNLFLRIADRFPKGTFRFREDGSSFPLKADLYEMSNQDLYSARTFGALAEDMAHLAIAEGKCACEDASAWRDLSACRTPPRETQAIN